MESGYTGLSLAQQSGYIGIDLAQIIFAIAIVIVLIGFAVWGWRTSQQIKKVETMLRDFRELEPEGYEEPRTLDTISEGARLKADAEAARERDIIEHQQQSTP